MKNVPLQLLSSAIIFVFAALLLWVMTHLCIPFLTDFTKCEPIIFWFICGGLGVFTPLIITGILMLRREGCEFTKEFFGEGYYFLARSWLLGVTHICSTVRDRLYFTLHSAGNW